MNKNQIKKKRQDDICIKYKIQNYFKDLDEQILFGTIYIVKIKNITHMEEKLKQAI